MKKMTLKISEIKKNPENPRTIKDAAFKKLVKSIEEFPEMLEAREVVVNTDYMILGGNMRFKAAKAAGLMEIPVKVVDWPEEKQREFVIKDNVSGGEWDWEMLANQWDSEMLDKWGLETPQPQEEKDDDFYTRELMTPAYEPKMNEPPAIGELVNTVKAEALIAAIDSSDNFC